MEEADAVRIAVDYLAEIGCPNVRLLSAQKLDYETDVFHYLPSPSHRFFWFIWFEMVVPRDDDTVSDGFTMIVDEATSKPWITADYVEFLENQQKGSSRTE